MGLTLSHTSALRMTRMLRAEGLDLRQGMDHITLARPRPWAGERWSMSEFDEATWRWPRPERGEDLHVLVASHNERPRLAGIRSHACGADLPAASILWVDEHASVVCPELLFVQMAEVLSLPELVLLGHELCGVYTIRHGNGGGDSVVQAAPATTKDEILQFIRATKRLRGSKRAREALTYVHEMSASVPESALATIYSLPPSECGYGMGPVVLNRSVTVLRTQDPGTERTRYPDLMFSFAPVGINYDGEGDHLDLKGLVAQTRVAMCANPESKVGEEAKLRAKRDAVRGKAVDDMHRNREFLAQGFVVLPMTKEDLYGRGNLDHFTHQLLACARALFGTNTSAYEETLNDSYLAARRGALLKSLLHASDA